MGAHISMPICIVPGVYPVYWAVILHTIEVGGVDRCSNT